MRGSRLSLQPAPRPSITERLCKFIFFLFKLVFWAFNALLLFVPGALLRRLRASVVERRSRVPQLGREAWQRAGKTTALPGFSRRSTFFGAVDPTKGRWARFTQRCCPRSTAFVQATSLMLILGYFATMMFGRSVVSVIQGIIGIIISVESYLAASRSDRHGLRWAALGMLVNTFASAAVGVTILIGTDVACNHIKAEYQGACNVTQSIYGLLMLLGSSSVGIFATINAVLVYFALGTGSSSGEQGGAGGGGTGSTGSSAPSASGLKGEGGATTAGGGAGGSGARLTALSLGGDLLGLDGATGAAGGHFMGSAPVAGGGGTTSGGYTRADSRSRSTRSLRAATSPAPEETDWQFLEELSTRTLSLLAANNAPVAGSDDSDDDDDEDDDVEEEEEEEVGAAAPAY